MSYTAKDLKVTGIDVMQHGVPMGPKVGEVLKELLELVDEGEMENRRADRMAWLKRREKKCQKDSLDYPF